MKKLLFIVTILLFGIGVSYSQVSNVADFRIPDATTAFGKNLPIGTKVYNVATDEYWVATAGVTSASTLTTASGSFSKINGGSLTADSVDDTHIDWGTGANQVSAADVPIEDSGAKITATDVEGALAENRTAIDLNTAKETNVTTDLSVGTVTATNVDVNSSDGTNATLPAATNAAAGVATAAQITKLEGIATGAEVNLRSITESFEESSGTPTAHILSQTAVTAQDVIVAHNGRVLKEADYTLAAGTITLNSATLDTYQYDEVTITYWYAP